jgi:transcription-repair coupling factor (superfamily II helicase)
MYKRFRGVESLEDIEELQEEILDRFGEYPDEVAYLFQVTEMKVYAYLSGVELIKQMKQEVTILLNEGSSSNIDGQKIFKISSQFGRMVSLGMDGQKLKMVLHIKGTETAQWLNVAFLMIKGLRGAEKEEENPVR